MPDQRGGDDVEAVRLQLRLLREAADFLRDRRRTLEAQAPVAVAPAASPTKGKTAEPLRTRRLGAPKGTRSQALRQALLSGKGPGPSRTTARDYRRVGAPATSAATVPHDEPGAALTSAEWLRLHGLRAQSLSIWQELADVAYTCSKPGQFVGRAYKTLAMVQWKDGTQKGVHIDIPRMAECGPTPSPRPPRPAVDPSGAGTATGW